MASLTKVCSRLARFSIVYRPLSTTSICQLRDAENVDVQTHTDQVWDKDDYRRIRFLHGTKMVNTEFAVNLVAKEPIVVVNARNVWSDGGGPIGHPKVFINLDQAEVGVCGYSGRKFIQTKFYNASIHGPSTTYEEYLKEPRS